MVRHVTELKKHIR